VGLRRALVVVGVVTAVSLVARRIARRGAEDDIGVGDTEAETSDAVA